MAKHRVRSKGNKKGRQRWAKGQSGASNPSKTKFRDAAKSRLLRGQGFGKQKPSVEGQKLPNGTYSTNDYSVNNAGKEIPSRLTAECLLRHEAVLGQIETSSGGTTGTLHITILTPIYYTV